MSKSDGWLPSYEESVNESNDSDFNTKTPRGQRIIDQLTVVRSQHIRSVIEQYVCPVVEEQARIGIAKTVLVLLPSDAVKSESDMASFDAGTQDPNAKLEPMGFSTDEDVRQIQLEGKMNQVGFWKQPEVVPDFQRALQERLSSLPQFQARSPTPVPASGAEFSKPSKLSKKSFFGRFAGSSAKDIAQDEPRPVAASALPAPAERVGVKIRIEEICLRTVSEFGLYETIDRQGVVVRVDARL